MGGYILGSHGPYWNGIPMIGAQPDVSGITLCVDSDNGIDGNSGQSWSNPLKTLSRAIALCNAYIVNKDKTDRRNTIFVMGDPLIDNLTVFPDKTDIIGCGSYMTNKHAGIFGRHVPVSGIGTRFINIYFKNSTSTSPIITLTNAVGGIEFHNCIFEAATGSPSAISITASPRCVIIDSKFVGLVSTASIYFGSGELTSVVIRNCDIRGSNDVGILVDAGATATYGASVEQSFITSANECIEDSSAKFMISDNNCFTGKPKGVAGAGAIICNVFMALNNRITCADVNNAVFPVQGTL